MQKLTINDYLENSVVRDKLLGFIPFDKKFKTWYVITREPNGTEHRNLIAKYEFWQLGDKNGWKLLNDTDEAITQKRKNIIQDLINKYAKNGYKVSSSQMALFINEKIDLLILEK